MHCCQCTKLNFLPSIWIVLLSYFVVGLHASFMAHTVQDVWYMQCKVKRAAMHGDMRLLSFRISEWNVNLDSQP